MKLRCLNKIKIVKGDITTVKCDVIVNAANSTLLGGGGVDGAIHRTGGLQILQECKEIIKSIGSCRTSQAVITNSGNLPCKKVIHTVGPIWYGGNNSEKKLLEWCYINSLELAIKNDLKTISFPNISTGVYRFPKEIAAPIAIESVDNFIYLNNQIEMVNFVCFDNENYKIYSDIMNSTL